MSSQSAAPGPHHEVQADAVRGSLWTLVASGVNLPLSLVVTTVAVRALGTEDFATFSLYTAVYLFAMPVFTGGVAESSMQSIAEAHAHGRRDDVVLLVRRVTGYHLWVQGPLTLGLTVFLLRDRPLAFLCVVVVAVAMFVALQASPVVLMATAQNAKAARFNLVMNLVSSPIVIAVALVSRSGSVTWGAQTACMVIAPAMAFIAMDADLRRAVLRPALPHRWPDGFVRYAVTALVAGYVAMLVFGRSELFVLSALDNAKAVAAFALICALAGKVTVLVDSLMAPIAPVAAGLVVSAPELAPRALGRALRLSGLLAAATVAVAVPAATALMPILFGGEFAYARPGLLALGIVSCLQTATAPLQAFAFATRSVRQMLLVNVCCLVVDVTLALALIGPLGLWGAVAASCAAQALASILLVFVMAARLAVPPMEVLKHLVVLVVCLPALVAAGAAAVLLEPTALTAVLAFVLGGVLLLAGIKLVRSARLWPEDVEMVARGLPARWSATATAVATRSGLVQGTT